MSASWRRAVDAERFALDCELFGDNDEQHDDDEVHLDDEADLEPEQPATDDVRGMTRGEALALAEEWRSPGVPAFPVAISWDDAKRGTRKRPLCEHGHLDATLDERALRLAVNKATLRPGEALGVGLHLGPAGFLAVDLDGAAALVAWDERGLPATYTSTTISGGLHVIWRKPEPVHVGTRCTWNEVDVIRSDDGWIVAPGTVTPWGEWVSHDDFSTDVEAAPPELWAVIDRGAPGAERSGGVADRGLERVLARLDADDRDQDADALRVLCETHGGHHPFRAADGGLYVTRPGKQAGTSASIGYVAPGVVKVFTTDWAPFAEGGRYVVAAGGSRLVDASTGELASGNGQAPANVDLDTGDILGPQPFPVATIGAMARAVDAAPPPSFVVRRLLVTGDYGVLGAEKKFGKSFNVGDLAVNVAAGGAFLGAFPVDHQGPVLLFAGEGGQRKLVRRFRAIGNHYDIDIDRLPLYIYERAPKLANAEQVARLAATVEQVDPVLVAVDPAYLALAGAETSNLASMGVLLERIQLITQDAGSALLLSHHWNKTGTGTAADRFTGAGFAEWGRVLLSGATLSRNTDPTTMATTAVCKLEVTGDEIADNEITYRRRVWVDDPDNLTSAMHYFVEMVDNATPPELDDTPGMKPAAARVLAVLRGADGDWLDHVQIGDQLADDGHPLKKRTILEAGQSLVEVGLVDESGGVGAIRKTFRAHPGVGNVL